jgi:hypothetical protein
MKLSLVGQQTTQFVALMIATAALVQCGRGKPETDFVGVWKLVSSTAKDGGGHILSDPLLGQHPRGYLIYGAGGHMCGQLTNPDRVKFANESSPTPDEALNAFNEYDAWCATYSIDSNAGTTSGRSEMDMNPNDSHGEYQRSLKFSGDGRLVITFDDSTGNGQTYTFTRVYERATPVEAARPTQRFP